MFYNKAKKQAIENLKRVENLYNELGIQANDLTLELYRLRKSAVKAIDRIEIYINMLANSPKEFVKDIADVKFDIQEFKEAIRIEEENASQNIKGATTAGGGLAVGGAIASLGPTAAMAIATTFGTASTGTAISALSGAAATNAALAWLGGGAVAAGGGGMAAGNAFLALAGPIGWGVAGGFLIVGGTFSAIANKKAAEQATKAIAEIYKKINILGPKKAQLESLCQETKQLKTALDISLIVNVYPNDYTKFSNEQKQTLATLINNVQSMGKLINERV